MIDEAVKLAMVTVAAFLIKLVFEVLGFPLTEELYFTLAGILVAYILALLGYEAVRALFVRGGKAHLFKDR